MKFVSLKLLIEVVIIDVSKVSSRKELWKNIWTAP